MNDDLERNLRDSLDRHATGAATSGGSVDDVYHRVDRQRARRRSVAVVGSIAAAAAGVIAFAAMGGGGSDPAADFAAPASEAPTTTIVQSANVYACTNYLGSQDVPAYGQREIYGDCVPVTWDVGLVATTTIAAIECVPITMLTTTTSTAVGCGSVVETAPPTTHAPSAPNCLSGAVVPTTAPPGSVTAYGEQQYVVVAGDSLFSIATMYGIAPDIIANYNGWTDCLNHPIFVGDTILIPPGALGR